MGNIILNIFHAKPQRRKEKFKGKHGDFASWRKISQVFTIFLLKTVI